MPFIGNKPSAVPLTSADIADSIITSAKIVDGTIVNADINASAAIDSTKLTGVQGKFESALLHVNQELSTGVDGGTSSSATFHTRSIGNVVTNEISGASLASNQITLPAGTYFIFATAPAYKTDQAKLYLRNVTDSTDIVTGTVSYHGSTINVQTTSIVSGRFTIAGSKDFEIRHYIATGKASDGLGVSTNASGLNEIYTDVKIWKVA